MQRVVSATQARIRFGEIMRQVVERREPVVVERGGKPYVVVLSVEEYERLRAAEAQTSWQETLNEVLQLNARIRARRGGRPLTPPEEIIREMREERDAELAGVR